MMLSMLFTNMRVLNLRFFCYSQDSRGSGLSEVSNATSSRWIARTANIINILQDKWYALNQKKMQLENTTHLKYLCANISRNLTAASPDFTINSAFPIASYALDLHGAV